MSKWFFCARFSVEFQEIQLKHFADFCKFPKWADAHRADRDLLTCNFIAMGSAENDDVVLYFVPRRRDRQFWNGNKGIVGGLEVLGELVLASDDECALVENGVVDYGFIEHALSAVCAPMA